MGWDVYVDVYTHPAWNMKPVCTCVVHPPCTGDDTYMHVHVYTHHVQHMKHESVRTCAPTLYMIESMCVHALYEWNINLCTPALYEIWNMWGTPCPSSEQSTSSGACGAFGKVPEQFFCLS